MLHPRAHLPLVLLTLLVGCVTVDGVLKADGSGTLQMTYRTPDNATEAMERRRYSSDHVKIDSLTITPGGMSTVKLSVDDATKLSTAAAFRDVQLTRTREGDAEKLVVKLDNKNPVDIKDDKKPGPTINLTLPGKVLEANHDGKVSGDHVTWSFTLREYAKARSTELTVRYTAAAGGEGAAPSPKSEPGK